MMDLEEAIEVVCQITDLTPVFGEVISFWQGLSI